MRGALGGPFAAIRGLAVSLLGTGHSRLKLLGHEIQIEKLRLLRQIGFVGALMFCLGVALLLAISLVVVLFWDQRVVLLAVFTALFAALAGFFYLALRRTSEDSGNLFAASLAELQEDLRQLKAAAASPTSHEKNAG